MIQKISESLYLFRAAIFQFGVKKAILKVPLSGIFVIHLTNFINYLCINCPLLEYCVFIVLLLVFLSILISSFLIILLYDIIYIYLYHKINIIYY